MICDQCRPLCATTRRQLANRIANMNGGPNVRVHACQNCGGIDWATSEEMINYAPPQPTLWRKILAKLRK